jgi:transcriptional regulator with XRE-family HTH domain
MAGSSAFGDRLRQAREARGVALDEVARATRISRRYLEALERSDLAALPGGAFNTGYIRTYAQHLSIDPQPLLEAYRAEERRRGQAGDVLPELARLVDERAQRTKRGARFSARGKGAAGAALAVLLLLSAAFWLKKTARVEPPRSPESPASEAGAFAVPESPGRPPVEEPPTSESDAFRAGFPASDATRPTTSDIAVAESRLGTGVIERAMVGENDRFPEGTRVWFWTRVVGGQPGEVLRHVWIHEGRTVARSELIVGGPHWRTYSRVVLAPGSAGSWAVEARSADGRMLARREFLCLPRQQTQSRP